ncbi:hypothetical protein R6Q57_023191 [Mikania cordata]
MALRKAMGDVKDQTSIGTAKVASNMAHSNSWDHSTFKLDLIMFKRKQNNGGIEEPDRFRDDRWRSPPYQGDDYGYNENHGYGGNMMRSMSFGDTYRSCKKQQVGVGCFVSCCARKFQALYADICEVLVVLLDRFFDTEYHDCVKAFDPYASAAKQIDELVGFYNWCKDMGISRSLDYPKVQKMYANLLETLQEFVREYRGVKF